MLPELMANLLHNLPGMAYRCKNDAGWTMIFLSEGCSTVTGYSASELLNSSSRSFNDLILTEDKEYVRRCVNEAIRTRTRFQMEYRIIGKAGDIRWVWEQGNAIYSADNTVMFLDGYIAEISSRKHIEEEIKHVAKNMVELNATKDKFFSLIAHDLQNPVYAIISLSEFLAANLHNLSTADLSSFATQIQISAKGIYALLENLLDWTKSQTGKIKVQREYLSLSKLLSFVISQLQDAATEKKISLEYSGDGEVTVESDSHLLSTIIRNLISNAIKYSHPNSVVWIKLSRYDAMVLLEVKDEGIGISRRNIHKIFSLDNDIHLPGTMKESGSGLGLILAKDFADKLGAQLSVVSKLNKGSVFTLKIPEKSS
jgi:PAS domain S-box-containing protein